MPAMKWKYMIRKRVKIKHEMVMQAAAVMCDVLPNVFDISSNNVFQSIKRRLAVVVEYEKQKDLLYWRSIFPSEPC